MYTVHCTCIPVYIVSTCIYPLSPPLSPPLSLPHSLLISPLPPPPLSPPLPSPSLAVRSVSFHPMELQDLLNHQTISELRKIEEVTLPVLGQPHLNFTCTCTVVHLCTYTCTFTGPPWSPSLVHLPPCTIRYDQVETLCFDKINVHVWGDLSLALLIELLQ